MMNHTSIIQNKNGSAMAYQPSLYSQTLFSQDYSWMQKGTVLSLILASLRGNFPKIHSVFSLREIEAAQRQSPPALLDLVEKVYE